MNLVKLTDNTSLVISKIEEQTPLKVSLEKKISKKQEDINAFKKALKKVNNKLNASSTKKEDNKSHNKKTRYRLFALGVVIFILFSIIMAFLATKYNSSDDVKSSLTSITILIIFFSIMFYYRKKVKKSKRIISKEITPDQKEKKSLDKKINNATKALEKIREEFSILSNNIDSLQTKKEVIESVIHVNKIYDADDNNDLDVAETSNIELIIKQKQPAIRKIEKQENRNYLRDFTKINIFLDSFQKQLVDDYEDIQSFCEIENKISLSSAQQKIETFESNITSYKALMSSLVLMISNLVNDDLVSFFKLYDIFDKLSVFESNYEKKVVQGFRDNANLTKQLIEATHESRDVIERALNEVGSEINSLQFEVEWLGKQLNK